MTLRVAILYLLTATPWLAAQCQPEWASGFHLSGTTDAVRALAVFDDGTGPALYAGGVFTAAGPVAASNIAKWDGVNWSPLGSGIPSASLGRDPVSALAVFDDGAGPALYVGGFFTTAGDVSARSIAKWDGQEWSALGTGVSGDVFALSSFDDGTRPALYAGGYFSVPGDIVPTNIAKWDGKDWSPLGGGTGGKVHALAVFDNGTGPALYAAGAFNIGDITPEKDRIVKWDGKSWSALKGTDRDSTTAIYALAAFDEGSGAALYAGGNMARGTAIITSGFPANNIAKWDGESWSALGDNSNGMNDSAFVLAVLDDGTGRALYAGGAFTAAGQALANRIAKWDGASWSTLGTGVGYVFALTVFDDGTGPALYADGRFEIAGGVTANRVAKWDGKSWSPLGEGMPGDTGPNLPVVRALAGFDDGTGPALYAGGYFSIAGEVEAHNVAKWEGRRWSALGAGTDAWVLALTPFDDCAGSALYAGGSFNVAGGAGAWHIGAWRGCPSAAGNRVH